MTPPTSVQDSQLPPNRARRWAWYLFDFANSILIINGSLYFPQWIVVHNKVSDTLFNSAFVISSLLLLVTGPILGRHSDRHGDPWKLLALSSLALFLGGLAIAVGPMLSNHTLMVTVELVAFFVVLYSYQLSLV